MIKNQNYAVESYEAPNCMIFNIEAKDILCTSLLSTDGGTEGGSIIPGGSWGE